MKRDAFAVVLCLSMAAITRPGRADDSPQTVPSTQAAELYKRGNELYDAGKLEEAEKLYRQAWSLARSYDIASNLGAVAFDRAKYRDAAEYLSFALASFPAGGKPTERTSIENALKQAKAHVFSMKIRAGVPRAQVLIDGAPIGELVAGAEVFVEPGARTIEVRAEGFVPQRTSVNATAGGARDVHMTLVAQPHGGPRRELLIAGGAAAGAGIVAGAVLLGVSASVLADAKVQRDTLVSASGRQVCDGPGAPAQCTEVQGSLQSAQDMGNVGAAMLIGAGLVGASTLIYALVARPKAAPPVSASLLVGSERAGIVLRGSF